MVYSENDKISKYLPSYDGFFKQILTYALVLRRRDKDIKYVFQGYSSANVTDIMARDERNFSPS